MITMAMFRTGLYVAVAIAAVVLAMMSRPDNIELDLLDGLSGERRSERQCGEERDDAAWKHGRVLRGGMPEEAQRPCQRSPASP